MKELVHNRGISIQSYDLGDHLILIEGQLIDHRYRPRNGEAFEDGKLIHDMVIRLQVRGPGMNIEKAEALMAQHPREECPVVLPWLQVLEGMRIAAGFTMKMKETIGDTKGCAHLTSLVIAMGPAAVQGYWAAYGVEKEKISLHEEAIKGVVNTCYLWREDGPLIQQLKEEMKSQG